MKKSITFLCVGSIVLIFCLILNACWKEEPATPPVVVPTVKNITFFLKYQRDSSVLVGKLDFREITDTVSGASKFYASKTTDQTGKLVMGEMKQFKYFVYSEVPGFPRVDMKLEPTKDSLVFTIFFDCPFVKSILSDTTNLPAGTWKKLNTTLPFYPSYENWGTTNYGEIQSAGSQAVLHSHVNNVPQNWLFNSATGNFSLLNSGIADNLTPGFSIADRFYFGSNDLKSLNVTNNQWTTHSIPPFDLSSFSGAEIAMTLHQKVYLGITNQSLRCWEYDPATDVWAALPDFPGKYDEAYGSIAVFPSGDKIAVVDACSELWLLDPIARKWEKQGKTSPAPLKRLIEIKPDVWIGKINWQFDLAAIFGIYDETKNVFHWLTTTPAVQKPINTYFVCGEKLFVLFGGKFTTSDPFGGGGTTTNYVPELWEYSF